MTMVEGEGIARPADSAPTAEAPPRANQAPNDQAMPTSFRDRAAGVTVVAKSRSFAPHANVRRLV